MPIETPTTKDRMPHFDPAKHTTEDVVRQATGVFLIGRRMAGLVGQNVNIPSVLNS